MYLRAFQPAFGQVAHHAAKAHIVAHQARAADLLEEVKDHLALFNGVQALAFAARPGR